CSKLRTASTCSASSAKLQVSVPPAVSVHTRAGAESRLSQSHGQMSSLSSMSLLPVVHGGCRIVGVGAIASRDSVTLQRQANDDDDTIAAHQVVGVDIPTVVLGDHARDVQSHAQMRQF